MEEKELLMIIGRNIKYYLEKNNMSQAELSRRINVSAQAVSNWVNGTVEIRMDKLDKICEVFKCKRSDLMDEHTDEDREHNDLMKRVMFAGGQLPPEALEPFALAMEAAVKALKIAEKKQ